MGLCTPWVDSSLGSVTVCTSATRPTGGDLYAGKVIFETDTKRMFVYDGAAWRSVAVETAWTAPTLLNSWVNYNGATHQVAQYRKVGDLVYVRGFIKSGTTTAGTVLLTLPVGFRPPMQVNFASSANFAAAGLNVQSTGDLAIDFGSNVWFAINCQFSVTA